MRDGGEDDDKGMVSVIERVRSLVGEINAESHERWDCFKIQEINRLKQHDFFFFFS